MEKELFVLEVKRNERSKVQDLKGIEVGNSVERGIEQSEANE